MEGVLQWGDCRMCVKVENEACSCIMDQLTGSDTKSQADKGFRKDPCALSEDKWRNTPIVKLQSMTSCLPDMWRCKLKPE